MDPDTGFDDHSLPLDSHFLVLCSIDERSRAQLADRRGQHLAYIRDHLSVIAFGGVTGPPDQPPSGICFALDVDTASAAEAFVAGDPYRSLYSSVRVEPFSQRVPSSRPLLGDDK